MTTSQPPYPDPSPELDGPSAGQFPADQPAVDEPAVPIVSDRSSVGLPVRSAAPGAWPPQYGQPPQLPPPPQFGRSPLFVSSPQFGRLPHNTLLREHARPQVPQPGTSAQTSQPEPPEVGALEAAEVPGEVPGPSADFGTRAISFLIDYLAPVIGMSLLLFRGVLTGGTAWRLVLAVVGYMGLLGFGIWNSGYLQGTPGGSLGRRVARARQHRRLSR